MVIIRDAGVPRDADLPALRPDQLDALVDDLIARSSTMDHADTMPDRLAATQAEHRRRWSGRASLLAVACAVVIIAVASVIGWPTAAPNVEPATPVSQAPAPNFPCSQPGGTTLTERAVYLPNPNYGYRTLMGMVGNQQLCTEEQPTGVTADFGEPQPGLVPYFVQTGNNNDTQQVYGVADGSVTRVRFIPNDATRAAEDAAALIAFGDDVAFYFPGLENGVVRFYRGDTVIAEDYVGPTPAGMITPVPSGEACSPTENFRPNPASVTLTDANGRAIDAEVYPERLDRDQPSTGTTGRLCLLVQWAARAVSVSAAPSDAGPPLTYLTETPAGGGTFIWGQLTGGAATVALTDDTGVVAALPAANLDARQVGQVSFVAFIPASAAQIVSAQALDQDGGKLGEPVKLP